MLEETRTFYFFSKYRAYRKHFELRTFCLEIRFVRNRLFWFKKYVGHPLHSDHNFEQKMFVISINITKE